MIEYILKNIFLIFGKENIKLAIYYGNKKGKDVDVFVIIAGKPEYNNLHKNKLDITYIGETYQKEMIENLDPLLTEPVLTGKVLYGGVKHIKLALGKARSSKNSIDYLMNKAFLYFQWANIHFQNKDLIYACDCIRFSIGFYCFASYYRHGSKVTTFSKLMLKFEDEYQLMIEIKKTIKNTIDLQPKHVETLLKKCKQLLKL